MAKLLIPINYKETNPGWVNTPVITMNGQLSGYEAHKAFTSDDREYLKVTGNIDMVNRYRSIGTQAIMMVSDNFFTNTSNQFRLYSDLDDTFENTMLNQITGVYGDGINYGDHMGLDSTKSGLTKSLITYGSNPFWCFRIAITPFASQRIQTLTHGFLFNLPDNYRLQEQDFNFKYYSSSVKHNSVGKIYYDGVQNNSIKRTHALRFEYLSDTDTANLLQYFKLGKGILPVWFIDDLNDNQTWMYCAMKSMSVKETGANYFNVSINLEEY